MTEFELELVINKAKENGKKENRLGMEVYRYSEHGLRVTVLCFPEQSDKTLESLEKLTDRIESIGVNGEDEAVAIKRQAINRTVSKLGHSTVDFQS